MSPSTLLLAWGCAGDDQPPRPRACLGPMNCSLWPHPLFDCGNVAPYQALSFLTQNLSVAVHRHATLQLVFSLDHPFDSVVGSVRYAQTMGFIVQAGCPHECTAPHSAIVVINVAPFSPLVRTLKTRYLGSQPAVALDARSVQPTQASSMANLAGTPREQLRDQAMQQAQVLMNQLATPTPTSPDGLDARVVESLHILRKELTEPPGLPQLARRVGLSQSRLTALFRSQLGLPVTRYLQWSRLVRATQRLLTDTSASMTAIAHDAGFYDLAHLHRVMHAMFGVAPQQLKDNSHFIQAFGDPFL